VEEGATVEEGQTIAVMEAMKMEVQVFAHRSGKITLLAIAGTAQTLGTPLARIE